MVVIPLLAWLALEAQVAAEPSPPQEARRPSVSDRIRGRDVAASLRPLENPRVTDAAGAVHMRDDDLVFGVELSGSARAYPWWIVKNYHVVDDDLAGVPVAVAFCEQCTGAAAFRRRLDGRALSFVVPGVYNGTIILQDRETRTLWAPFSGRALEGQLAGRTLERIPVSLMRWDEWKRRRPDTDVVWQPEAMREGHGSWYAPGKWGIVSEMGATLQSWDSRLPENTLVYGIETGGEAKAFPLSSIAAQGGVVNDEVAEVPVVLAASGRFAVSAYERTVDGKAVTFVPGADPQGPITDRETGSTWSAEGKAVTGPLRGRSLRRIDGYLVEWHVWSAYNPNAALFGSQALERDTPGKVALPPLVLQRLDGPAEAVRLPGAVNLLAVWAPWCPPCREELPRLAALAREYGDRGVSALGMAVLIPEQQEVDAVRRFVNEAGIGFPVFLVDEDSYGQLESLAKATGGPGLVLPTVFVADRQGRVLAVFRGSGSATMRTAVEQWLSPRR